MTAALRTVARVDLNTMFIKHWRQGSAMKGVPARDPALDTLPLRSLSETFLALRAYGPSGLSRK